MSGRTRALHTPSSPCRYGLTAEQIREVEQKIEEIRASMQPAAGGSGAGASLMSEWWGVAGGGGPCSLPACMRLADTCSKL